MLEGSAQRVIRAFAAAAVAAVAVAAILWRVSSLPDWQIAGEIVPRVATSERIVALTLDDGPVPDATHEVLAELHSLGIRATFFLVGESIQKYPEAARAIVAAGHEIGNHSYSHQRMILTTRGAVRDEVERTDALIRASGQVGVPAFRAPYGKKLLALPSFLAETGRVHVTWDVEPDDDAPAEPDVIAARALAQTGPGSIILMHVMFESRAASRQALRPIVTGLLARGYRFATVSELLALR